MPMVSIGFRRIAVGVFLFFAVGIPELLAQQKSARVALDVVVQDSSGNAVTDLAAGDFDVAVDGRSLPVTGVEFVGEGSRSPRRIFSPPFPTAGDALRSIVIVIDTLALPSRSRITLAYSMRFSLWMGEAAGWG